MSQTDVDNLESGGVRSRCRRMDTCLVCSVLALFTLVLVGFGGALLVTHQLREDLKKLQDSPQAKTFRMVSGTRYKARNFAYLRATSAEVRNGTMQWESMQYGNGETVGSGYTYDSTQMTLRMEQEGSYFLYTQLKLSCTYRCESGSLTLTFQDQDSNERLSCTIRLQGKHPEPVAHKCWAVVPRLERDSRLLARMSSKDNLENWKLEPNSSGFGMFLVDGPGED